MKTLSTSILVTHFLLISLLLSSLVSCSPASLLQATRLDRTTAAILQPVAIAAGSDKKLVVTDDGQFVYAVIPPTPAMALPAGCHWAIAVKNVALNGTYVGQWIVMPVDQENQERYGFR